MTELSPIEIKATREFQRKIRLLSKKYRNLQNDLQPILEKLRLGETLGDRISGIKSVVYKLRIKNTLNIIINSYLPPHPTQFNKNLKLNRL